MWHQKSSTETEVLSDCSEVQLVAVAAREDSSTSILELPGGVCKLQGREFQAGQKKNPQRPRHRKVQTVCGDMWVAR